MVQLSHSYTTTAKSTALTVRTFVSKMLSLLSNMLSRFIIAFLPRSKRLLISRLQSPPAMILEPKKITSITANSSHIHEYAAFSHTQTQKRELSFTSSFFLFFFFSNVKTVKFNSDDNKMICMWTNALVWREFERERELFREPKSRKNKT